MSALAKKPADGKAEVLIAKVEDTQYSGKYYYYYVNGLPLKAYIPEKKFMEEVRDLVRERKEVLIKFTTEGAKGVKP